jgi:hypothetical protein
MMRSLLALSVARSLAALAVAVAAAHAHAGLYKCAAEKGAVVYQDAPCAEGRQLRDLERDPPQLSVVPGTPVPPRATKVVKAAAPKPAKARASAARRRGGDAGERKFLRMGMSEAEVVHRIGRPDMRQGGRRKEGQQWSYLPTAGDADTLTTVTFVDGMVSRVERKVVR